MLPVASGIARSSHCTPSVEKLRKGTCAPASLNFFFLVRSKPLQRVMEHNQSPSADFFYLFIFSFFFFCYFWFYVACRKEGGTKFKWPCGSGWAQQAHPQFDRINPRSSLCLTVQICFLKLRHCWKQEKTWSIDIPLYKKKKGTG